jgi:hypothetical protein
MFVVTRDLERSRTAETIRFSLGTGMMSKLAVTVACYSNVFLFLMALAWVSVSTGHIFIINYYAISYYISVPYN